MSAALVTLAQIRQAQAELPPQVVRTPMLASEGLSAAVGAPVWLKCENLQVTGAYKARATFTLLNRLAPEHRQKGAALSSSGNFAQAFAYMGRLLGIPTTAVMSSRTSPFKVERTRRLGARIVSCGPNFEDRWATLFALAEEGILPINTFESEEVIIGHGTLGIEMLEQLPEADTILVPTSSGGLIAGIAVAVKALRPSTQVIGVNPAGSNAVTLSFQRGEAVTIPQVETICDALVAACPGKLPFAHIQRYVDDMVTVTDDEAKAAIVWLVEHAKLVAEAGGAVAVAALLTGKVRAAGKTIALVSGGNIMPSTLAEYLHAAAAGGSPSG